MANVPFNLVGLPVQAPYVHPPAPVVGQPHVDYRPNRWFNCDYTNTTEELKCILVSDKEGEFKGYIHNYSELECAEVIVVTYELVVQDPHPDYSFVVVAGIFEAMDIRSLFQLLPANCSAFLAANNDISPKDYPKITRLFRMMADAATTVEVYAYDEGTVVHDKSPTICTIRGPKIFVDFFGPKVQHIMGRSSNWATQALHLKLSNGIHRELHFFSAVQDDLALIMSYYVNLGGCDSSNLKNSETFYRVEYKPFADVLNPDSCVASFGTAPVFEISYVKQSAFKNCVVKCNIKAVDPRVPSVFSVLRLYHETTCKPIMDVVGPLTEKSKNIFVFEGGAKTRVDNIGSVQELMRQFTDAKLSVVHYMPPSEIRRDVLDQARQFDPAVKTAVRYY